MTALLGLLPLKDWVYSIIIVALIAFGVYEKHHLIAEGQQHELAALKLSSDKLQKQTAKQTAELQARATMAEQAYDKEHQAILNQPSLPAVRLCGNAHRSSSIVSATGATQQGNAAASASSGDLQSVPAGSDSVGTEQNPDISSLLSLLAQRADDYSAELREYQARE
jgi:hypothetical protein